MQHIINGIHIGDTEDAQREWVHPTVDGIVCCEEGCECIHNAQRAVFDIRFLDGAHPPVERFPALIAWVKERDRILVHCRAGVSRSAAIAAFIIARRWAYSPRDALGLVRAVRPIVNPHSRIWRCIMSHGKVKGIDKYEQEITKLRAKVIELGGKP